MDTISIIITASGILGLALTILSFFFDIKPSKREIFKKDMVSIIIWLGLTILGFINLYYRHNENNTVSEEQNNSIQTADIQENASNDEVESKEDIDTNNMNVKLSEDELLINKNFDLIQRLKAEYSDEDTEFIKNGIIEYNICERAGFLYQDSSKTKNSIMLKGENVIPTKMIILDYISDEIICAFSPKENSIWYSHEKQNRFYCIVFHNDYDIYVTPPIQIDDGESYSTIDICLNKKNSNYTSLFQLNLIESGVRYNNYDKYIVKVYCKKPDSNVENNPYRMEVSDKGIALFQGYSYFSLNTNYIMDISLYNKNDLESQLMHQIYIATEPKQVNIYYDYNN